MKKEERKKKKLQDGNIRPCPVAVD